jgi:predicted amidohydrolase YtcJ
MPMTADLLLINGNVVTMDPARPRARSVAIAGGRIVAVGGDPAGPDGVRARQVADLRGATLLPGFHDAHNHMTWHGITLSEVDLRPEAAPTLADLYQAVAERASATAPDDWVTGSGYDQNKLGAHPDRDGLDRAAPGRRVWLRHTSGHMCVVSSAVLGDLGLAEHPAEVPGGRVVTDAAGRPTGLLQERARELVGGLVHPYPVEVLADAIDRAGARYLNAGEAITAEQALRAYTCGSAYASHAESTRGMIKPGMLADLVVLSEDPVAVSPASIAGIEVLGTFVAGECRFDATGTWA